MSKTKRDVSGLLKAAREKKQKTLLRVNEILKRMIREKQKITC